MGGGYRPILNQVNFPGSTSQLSQLRQLQPSPAQSSVTVRWGRCRDVAVTDCVWCVCVVCVCMCEWRVYVCLCMCMYVCLYMYVCAGGLSGAPLLLLLPKACPKYIHTIQAGQHIVCGHCSCRGLLQSRGLARLVSSRRSHSQSPLRDRRGLYFGGGCLIPRADPSLWVCLGPAGLYVEQVSGLRCFLGSGPCTACMYVCMYVCLTFSGGVLFLTFSYWFFPSGDWRTGLSHCYCCCGPASWSEVPGNLDVYHRPRGFANPQKDTSIHTR